MVFHHMELTKAGTAFLYTIEARNVKIQMGSPESSRPDDAFRFLDKNKGLYETLRSVGGLALSCPMQVFGRNKDHSSKAVVQYWESAERNAAPFRAHAQLPYHDH